MFALNIFSFLYFSVLCNKRPIDVFVQPRFILDPNVQLLVCWVLTKILADIENFEFSIPFMEILYRGNVQREVKRSGGGLRFQNMHLQQVREKYGSDVLRFLLLYYTPPGHNIDWGEIESSTVIQSISRMLRRLYNHIHGKRDILRTEAAPGKLSSQDRALLRKAHKTIKFVTEKMASHRFDMAAHSCFSLARKLLKAGDQEKQIQPAVQRETAEILLQLLAPFTPFICLELWTIMGNTPSTLLKNWPQWDSKTIKDEERQVVVQLNGKTRAKIIVDGDATEEEVVALARQDDIVAKHLGQKQITGVFFIKGRLLNLVLE